VPGVGTTISVALSSLVLGGAVGALWRHRAALPRLIGRTEGNETLTRIDAHLAAEPRLQSVPGNASGVLRRDVELTVEQLEASHDLEMLDAILRDFRDLTAADETIFWRWIENRETLVPTAWSSEAVTRPTHFDVDKWSPLVRWCAEEERPVHFGGENEGTPVFSAAPVVSDRCLHGVLTITGAKGLRIGSDSIRDWAPRFAGQLVGLLELIDMRRQYGRIMRQNDSLLDAVHRLHEQDKPEALAKAICDTACEVSSVTGAALVRWFEDEDRGVVQYASFPLGIPPGTVVPVESLVGRACTECHPLALDDARSATTTESVFGGPPIRFESLVIHPIQSGHGSIGALVVEGSAAGELRKADARNVGLLAALARGPLEAVWKIEEVSRRARTDGLTGLANRTHFDEQIRRVVAETDRFGGSCSLIVADLDHFKQINDVHGHEAGDAVLRHVAQLLADGVRTIDVCARYGGEEIAILLPQTSLLGAVELADRLRAALESRPCRYGGSELNVTASFGVASYPAPVSSSDGLFPAADRALYEAKASGRNCVRSVPANRISGTSYRSA
jgi:diguanylate cyclase (GGDEF)-like protein